MPFPLVVDALRGQLLRVMDWYGRERHGYRWGVVLHRRNERGRARFGAVTASGESLLLSEPLLERLSRAPCWLDGAVHVRLESRSAVTSSSWLQAVAEPTRAPLVDALAVYFDPDTGPAEAEAFRTMAGVLTPTNLPSELFLLTREHPPGWPL